VNGAISHECSCFDGIAERRYGKNVSRKSHPGKGAVVEKEAKKPSMSVVDKSSGTGKSPGSKKEVTIGSKDPLSLSPGGIPLLDDPNVQNFIFVLLQMMLQMSLGASQNVSVAAAMEREEKVDDDGEKEVEAVEEVNAVNLCTSEDEKEKI